MNISIFQTPPYCLFFRQHFTEWILLLLAKRTFSILKCNINILFSTRSFRTYCIPFPLCMYVFNIFFFIPLYSPVYFSAWLWLILSHLLCLLIIFPFWLFNPPLDGARSFRPTFSPTAIFLILIYSVTIIYYKEFTPAGKPCNSQLMPKANKTMALSLVDNFF